jgi:hypothetical protein
MKWPKPNHMTCIHGLGSCLTDYAIFDILVYNQIVNFDILKNHEPDFDHRPLTPSINFGMHKIPIE